MIRLLRTVGVSLFLLNLLAPSDAAAQTWRLGAGGIEFGSRKGFVWAEAIYDRPVPFFSIPATVRFDVALGRRSWGLKKGFEYRDGRTRIVDDQGTQVQPDSAFEQWSTVATAGAFVMLAGRFGPGVIVEGVRAPSGGVEDEPDEDTSLVTAALAYSQPLGRGLELSVLWNATTDGDGRFRTTVVWVF